MAETNENLREPEAEIETAETPVLLAAPCRHLRSKGMYVYTDGETESSSGEEYDTSIYWCLQTMKDSGPDYGFVSRTDCRDCSRSCYEAL
ncbi:MAG: hypothetical protein NVSMB14_08090 [Isosphaeraceae bacterium]